VSALVSLIKAAHLTLFKLLGYRYALSAGGYFVGHDILGEFFLKNHTKTKSEVLESALPYFREFGYMVRPIQSSNLNIKGTISDGLLHVCKGHGNSPWALIVYIGTSNILHAVMMPIFDNPEAVERFMSFLRNDNEDIEVNLCHFDKDHWEINKDTTKLVWPKTGILYPATDGE
jgi:hypothetical protein